MHSQAEIYGWKLLLQAGDKAKEIGEELVALQQLLQNQPQFVELLKSAALSKEQKQQGFRQVFD